MKTVRLYDVQSACKQSPITQKYGVNYDEWWFVCLVVKQTTLRHLMTVVEGAIRIPICKCEARGFQTALLNCAIEEEIFMKQIANLIDSFKHMKEICYVIYIKVFMVYKPISINMKHKVNRCVVCWWKMISGTTDLWLIMIIYENNQWKLEILWVSSIYWFM